MSTTFEVFKQLIGHTLLCSLVLASLISTATVQGAIHTTYSDRASFEAALGTKIVDDYENAGYVFNQSDAGMTAVLGETAYRTTGFLDHNLIFDSGGDQHYCAGCNGSFELDFTATSVSGANGVFGVGFEFFNAGNPQYNAFITFGDGTTSNIPLALVSFAAPLTAFFGVTSDDLIQKIHFGLATGGTTTSGSFGLDNLTIGDSGVVPEPTAFIVWGLLGASCFCRRKGMCDSFCS